MRRILCAFLALFAAAALTAQSETVKDARSGAPAKYAGRFLTGPHVKVPVTPVFKKDYFRGVWVATVENIDIPRASSPEDFKREYIKIVDDLRRINANAVIFQVRPTNDAFYASRLNPYSKYLSGTEGVSLGFDPMPFMINEAHRRGLEFHAWLNPYRISHNSTLPKAEFLRSLAKNNFARKNPSLVIDIPNGKRHLYILDPGDPRTSIFFLNTVREIITHYNVDAIHLDDYFYPYENIGAKDSISFKLHNPRNLPLEDWRRKNIDDLIFGLSGMIRSHNRNTGRSIRLGISPFGIWANQKSLAAGSLTGGSQSYFNQHADTRKWARLNWIDYIVPQLYWTFGHDVAAYAGLADWWAFTLRNSKTKLYIGHSPARLGTTAEWSDPMEIYNQMRYNSRNPMISGSVMFSYSRLFHPENDTMKKGSGKIIDAWKKMR